MTSPSNPWSDNALVNAATLYANVTVPIATVTARMDANDAGGSWITIGSASSINSSGMATKVGALVLVRGIISPSSSWLANSTYSAVVTFPAGYRPSASGVNITRLAVGNSPNAVARLQLKADGTVDLLTGSTAPTSMDISCLSGFLAQP